MRSATYSDVAAAVRAVYAVENGERVERCRVMLHQADTADRYTRRLGKVHPRLGGGTLAEVASRYPQRADAGFDDAEVLECWILVLRHLGDRPRTLHV